MQSHPRLVRIGHGASTGCEAELLALMASQRERPGEAKDAWGELYERHRRYLYVVVSRAHGSFLGEDGVVDIVVDTFQRAFEWAGRQESPAQVWADFEGPTPDTTRRRVLGWLGAIAAQLFRDRYRESASDAKEHDAYLADWKAAQEPSAEAGDLSAREMLTAALISLRPEEADAIRASLPWYDPDRQEFSLPRGEATRIATALGTTPDAFRQRRHRGLRRIEEELRRAGYAPAKQEERS